MTQRERDDGSKETESDNGKTSGIEPRQIDATAMKAFAHPLRMAMYDYLNDHGSATATMLAKHTGESTGQTSYHLRQLERHGFVTDDATRGTGRERWWKAVGFSMHGVELAKDSSTRPAVASMLQNQDAQRSAAITDWYQRSEQESEEWIEASINSRHSMLLTQEEAVELKERAMAVLHHYAELSQARMEGGPEAEVGARRIRVYLDIFPLPEIE